MYENLSLVYDSLTKDVDYVEWTNYLKELIEKNSSNTKNILEYGCGSGNLTIPLSKFYKIVGVDNSEEMLTLAEQKLENNRDNIELLKGDMRLFNYPKRVDVILIGSDTINYLNLEELRDFFKKSYYELDNKGLLVFDMASMNYLTNYIAENNFIFDTGDIFFTWESEIIEETIISNFNFFVKDKDRYIRFEEENVQYYYGINEIVNLLKEVGFNDIKSYSFLTFDESNEEEDRIQFVAKKI